MAETTGYEYDIFISYAHDDNSVLSGDKGWVTEFHGLLSNWLMRQRGLKQLKIWFDESNLDGNTRFDDAIKNGVEKSALFFVIHSQNYQNSAYCNQELDWFLDHNKKNPSGIRIGDESRLFNIQIQNLHFDSWSDKLAGTSGFVLHDSQNKEDLGFPTSAQNNGRVFDGQMRKVVEATAKTIEALKQLAPKEPKPPEDPQAINGPTLFIANVPDSLKAFRKQLISEVSHKATILDALPPPFEFDAHAKQLESALTQANLSIHLLDQFGGTEIVGINDGSTFPKVQADTARKRDQHSLVWVPDTLKIEDIEEPEQASWLDELENGTRQSTGFHFVRSTRQAFIDQVNQVIDELAAQSQGPELLSRFLIDTHQKDQRYAFDLANQLAKRGIGVDFNQESSDPVKSLENFENVVRDVENLIIMFGQVAPQWVNGRIRTAIKIIADQLQIGDSVLDAIWIFMLPNCPGEAALPKVPALFKLNCLDNSTQDDIDEAVVKHLLNSQGGAIK